MVLLFSSVFRLFSSGLLAVLTWRTSVSSLLLICCTCGRHIVASARLEMAGERARGNLSLTVPGQPCTCERSLGPAGRPD